MTKILRSRNIVLRVAIFLLAPSARAYFSDKSSRVAINHSAKHNTIRKHNVRSEVYVRGFYNLKIFISVYTFIISHDKFIYLCFLTCTNIYTYLSTRVRYQSCFVRSFDNIVARVRLTYRIKRDNIIPLSLCFTFVLNSSNFRSKICIIEFYFNKLVLLSWLIKCLVNGI